MLADIHARAMEVPRPWSAAEIEALLRQPGVFLCAIENGFALGRVVADEAELLTLAVAPEARRRGQGRRLVAAFLTEAAARAAGLAFLEVAATNAPAIALYRAAGFGQTGRRPGYYRSGSGAGVDALVMQRALAG